MEQRQYVAAANESSQVQLELRFISVPKERLKTLKLGGIAISQPPGNVQPIPTVSLEDLQAVGGIQLISARKVTTEQQPVVLRRLADEEVGRLIEAAQQDDRSNILFAPKLRLFDGQTAQVADVKKRPFVTQLTPTGNTFQPRVNQLSEGTTVDVRATIVGIGVKLDAMIDFSHIDGVRNKSGGPPNTQIQVPRLTSSQCSLSALIQDGQSLLVSGLERTTQHRVEERKLGLFKNVSVGTRTETLLILITPRIIPAQQAVTANTRG